MQIKLSNSTNFLQNMCMTSSSFLVRATLVVCAFIFSIANLQATHIIGGDITYRHITDNRYEISLTLRRDCNLGQVGYDDPAVVGVFSASTNLLIFAASIPFMASDTIGNTIVSNCGFEGSQVCVQRTTYRDTISLPFVVGGYVIAYQRCCRNGSLTNVVSPLESGSTVWVEVTEGALIAKNSSPAFISWPDVYICANKPLMFNHSARDINGDSLVYKVCNPYDGASISFPRPQPPTGPPYNFVSFALPYTINNFMGGTPLAIDPKTGIINGNPNLVGQFLIGVCVEEYRNGVLLSTVRRDFQYNVRVCAEPVIANFEVVRPPCDSLSFMFNNSSSNNANRFIWNFNYPSTDPVFRSTAQSPSFVYTTSGTYKVALTVSTNNGACDSTLIKTIIVSERTGEPEINLLGDFVSVCPGDSVALLLNVDPTYTYRWNPTEDLDLTDTLNPIFVGDASAVYIVTVTTPTGCSAQDTISLNVLPKPTPIIITGPSNSCDRRVNLLASGGNINTDYEWSYNLAFTVIVSNNPRLLIPLLGDSLKVYVRSLSSVCSPVVDSITVFRQDLDIDYDQEIKICRGNNGILIIKNNDVGDLRLNFSDPHVTVSGDTLFITTFDTDVDTFEISGEVTNNFGCSGPALIKVIIQMQQEADFTATLQSCEDYRMCFATTGTVSGGVLWTFGTSTADSTSMMTAPCYEYPKDGTYVVTLESNTSSACPFEKITKTITVPQISDKKVIINATLSSCNTGEFCFDITGDYQGDILWDFGDSDSGTDTSTQAKPCYTFTKAGTYTVRLTNGLKECPFDTVTQIVSVPERLMLNAGTDQIVCEGQAVVLNATANVSGTKFTWCAIDGSKVGEGERYTFSPMVDIKIILKGESVDGCTAKDTVDVVIFKFDYTIDLPSPICPNGEFQAIINIANAVDYTFIWTPVECIVNGGNTSSPILVAAPNKTVKVVITNIKTGCSETRELKPNVLDLIVFGINGSLCNDQPSTMMLTIANAGNYNYQWSPNSSIVSGGDTANPIVKVGNGQQLTVVVTDKVTGCSVTRTFTPSLLPSVTIDFLETNIEIKEGQFTDLSIRNAIQNGTYVWSTGESGTSIRVTPKETTTYAVTATDSNGCTGTGQVVVTVRGINCTEADDYLPNAFTPNGDDVNDRLTVKSEVIESMTLVIYNRWGQEVFRSIDINDGWDGTYKGKKLSPDVYAYYLDAKCVNGDQFLKKGNVSLLK